MCVRATYYLREQRTLGGEVGTENGSTGDLFVTVDFSVSLTELLEFEAIGV
jgi:hypothetical protein